MVKWLRFPVRISAPKVTSVEIKSEWQLDLGQFHDMIALS